MTTTEEPAEKGDRPQLTPGLENVARGDASSKPKRRKSVPGEIYGHGMNEIPIEIIRSKRRKRTVQAAMADGRLEVRVPEGLDPAEEARIVEQVVGRARRKLTSAHIDLADRARRLARRYDLPQPESVEWSARQTKRWGSCTPDNGRLRISDRLASMPGWVLDSVLVHELAHLVVADHGPQFQMLVERYELTERATGYLMAKGENGTF